MLKITVRGMHDDAIWNQIDNGKILYFLKSANSFPQWQKIRKRDIIFIDSENDRRSHRAGKRVEPDLKGACLFLSLENCRHMALAFSDDCHFFCRSNGPMLHTRGTKNAARIKQSVILRIVALDRICCKSFSSAKRKLWAKREPGGAPNWTEENLAIKLKGGREYVISMRKYRLAKSFLSSLLWSI